MHWKRLVLVVFLIGIFASPAFAERRIALVIGNSAYQHVTPLPNPRNDAILMANTLQRLGFSLVGGAAQVDLDKSGFDKAVQSFGNQLIGADVALFYYAGHGVQVNGSNYLVPVTANPVRETDVDFQMVDVALVLRQMKAAGTRLNIVILDACRNNPFGGRGLRSVGGGLAQIRAPDGTLISYATQPGNVALDGENGHSPYTAALVQTIQKPGLDVLDAFNQVGLVVKRATAGAQEPWVSSSPIDGSFHFAGPESHQVATAEPPDAPVTPPAVISVPARPTPVPLQPTQSDFIFPDSDTRLLTLDDLKGRSKENLRIARNEIFARRGRYFNSPDMVARFSRFSWYRPYTWNPQLNPIETANVNFLARAENAMGPAFELIFPDSDRRLLSAVELTRLSKSQLRIARNEIFARRGRYFTSPDLKAYFAHFSWYSPYTWHPELNPIEQANVALIDRIEKQ